MIHLKLPHEIAKIRKSADLVGRAHGEVAKAIRVGVTTEELDAIAEDYIRTHNGKPAFKGYGFDRKNLFPSTLCISVNDVVVHGMPGAYALAEGDIVSIDCGVNLDGYFGDYAYTYAIGEISEEKKQLLKVTYESLYVGIEEAVVGKRTGDIGFAIQQYCESRGYGVVRELCGHGCGKRLHEDPQVPNYGKRGGGKNLKDGLVICIEPMINAGTAQVHSERDGWTVRTADRKPSAHYEHQVVCRRGKAEILSTFEYIQSVNDTHHIWENPQK
jgi:methionyl aminopeptidase